MINVAQFRADFPAFADAALYPAPQVEFWLSMAGQLINTARWGSSAAEVWPVDPDPIPTRTLFDLGTELFVAHNLALMRRATLAAGSGGTGIPGLSQGIQSNKSVDKVSVGYDVNAGLDMGAGHWNLTLYGSQFYRMMMMAGAGPIQIGGGYSPYATLAWPGPSMWPPG